MHTTKLTLTDKARRIISQPGRRPRAVAGSPERMGKRSEQFLEDCLNLHADMAYCLAIKVWGGKGKPTRFLLAELVVGTLEPEDVIAGLRRAPTPCRSKGALTLFGLMHAARRRRLLREARGEKRAGAVAADDPRLATLKSAVEVFWEKFEERRFPADLRGELPEDELPEAFLEEAVENPPSDPTPESCREDCLS